MCTITGCCRPAGGLCGQAAEDLAAARLKQVGAAPEPGPMQVSALQLAACQPLLRIVHPQACCCWPGPPLCVARLPRLTGCRILEDMGVMQELVDANEAQFANSGGFVSPSGLSYIGAALL